MKVTITKQEKNPLLGRTDVSAMVSFEGATPSNQQIAEAIGSSIKGEVVVKGVYTEFSKQEAVVKAVVYDSKEAKDKAERMTKHLRKQAEDAAKKAADAKAAAEEEKKKAEEEKAAASAEESKEEAPAAEEAPAEEKKEEASE